MTALSKSEKELLAWSNRFIFLKCDHCNSKFAMRWGFYTVCSCPNCKKDVRSYDEKNRLDNNLSEEEKLMLINEYFFRKFMSKLTR